VHGTKISAEFEFGGHSPLGAHPQNVTLGYDGGKIIADCLVSSRLSCTQVVKFQLIIQLRENNVHIV